MSPEMSQTLTQTNAGTPMGNLMRRTCNPLRPACQPAGTNRRQQPGRRRAVKFINEGFLEAPPT